ncbi:hypothetical protein Mapa_003307 [Marchantia paleacea]|nr:hypothetical protein Mapa_003307 [Marchantia paleacea]
MLTLLQDFTILCYTLVICCRSRHAKAHRVPNHIPDPQNDYGPYTIKLVGGSL